MTRSAFLVAEICIKRETGNSINTAGGTLKSKLPTEGTGALISVRRAARSREPVRHALVFLSWCEQK